MSTEQVYSAWTAALEQVRAVPKGDVNQGEGFKYRSIDAVMNAVHGALAAHGLAIIPAAATQTRTEVQSRRGAAGAHLVMDVTFRVIHASGESFTALVVGEATDYQGRCTSKAYTMALKTFLLQALCIPLVGEDPDGEQVDEVAPGEDPRITCRRIIDEWAAAHYADPAAVRTSYFRAGGTADPARLAAWLDGNTHNQEGN